MDSNEQKSKKARRVSEAFHFHLHQVFHAELRKLMKINELPRSMRRRAFAY